MKYLFMLLLSVACGGDNFKKVEKLDGFRILGIYADKPEVAPGDNVEVKVIVSDVSGTSETISGTYERCVDPGISRGASVSCAHDPEVSSGPFAIKMSTLFPDSDGRSGISDESLNFQIPPSILDSKTSRDQFNGVGYIVIFKFIVNDVEHTAFKRIIATNRAILNINPTGSLVYLNGLPLGVIAPIKGDKLTVSSSSPETYDYINVDGVQETREEIFEVAWYSSSGNFDRPKTFLQEAVEYQGSEASQVTIAIIRDGRGGVDFYKAYVP